MKLSSKLVTGLLLVAATLSVAAENPPSKAEQNAMKEKQTMKKELKRAEQQLREASRKIAEISAKLSTDKAFKSFDKDFLYYSLPRGPRLGILLETDPAPATDAKGLLITGVSPGGPAQEAGLKAGDIMTSYNGKPLARAEDGSIPYVVLKRYMKGIKEGDKVSVEYLREDKPHKAVIKVRSLGPKDWSFVPKMHMEKFGPAVSSGLKQLAITIEDGLDGWNDVQMVELNPDLGRYFGKQKGVLVVSVPDDSTLGLKAGDIILKIGARGVDNPSQAARILRSYEPGEELAFTLFRNHSTRVLKVKTPKTSKNSKIMKKYRIRSSGPHGGKDEEDFEWHEKD